MSKKTWSIVGVLGTLFIVFVVPGCVVLNSYNRLVTMNESIDGSWAQVENVLQRRYDLIPNLVNTVKCSEFILEVVDGAQDRFHIRSLNPNLDRCSRWPSR